MMKPLHQNTIEPPINSQAVLKNFFKICPDLLCLRSAEGYFLEVNNAWTENLGWTAEELRSRPWIDFICPGDRDYTEEMEVLALRQSVEYKNRFRCKDGSECWLQWRVAPYEDGISCAIAKDVTENRWQGSQSYRQAVQEAVQLRDRALAASSVGIVIADARLEDMPLIYVNPAFESMTGYRVNEVLGTNCRFLQGKDTDRAEVDRLRDAIRAGKDCTVTLLNYRKDKTPFWNELTISPVYEGAQLTHFIGIQVNVTARITAEKALRLEKRKSETLLLNILPKPIVEQLKDVRGSLAQQFPEVTILFADLVGFTALSAQMQPIELVALLNQIFSTFDRLAEKHGIEKIKTLGDAYMAVGGLPIYRENHAEAIAEIALEMQDAIARLQTELNKPLQMRIGINTGSVVAGVIGIKKFIYDLWGDAVNIASRMESLGEAGKIQVSEETYRRLNRKFTFEKRGEIEVKGKGKMTTYWLVEKNNS